MKRSYFFQLFNLLFWRLHESRLKLWKIIFLECFQYVSIYIYIHFERWISIAVVNVQCTFTFRCLCAIEWLRVFSPAIKPVMPECQWALEFIELYNWIVKLYGNSFSCNFSGIRKTRLANHTNRWSPFHCI